MTDHLVERGVRFLIRHRTIRRRHSYCRHGASVNDAFHAVLACRFEQAARAFDVALVNFLGIARPEAVVGGDVKDAANSLHCAAERKNIAEVAFAAFDRKILDQERIATHAHQYADRVTGFNELPGYVASHEPGGTRYKNVHKMRKASFSCLGGGT